jgi:DNA ligase D-like protein (predicted ligase)
MCLLGAEWSYEVKWDGIRAIITVEEGVVQIKTRSQRDVTANFPELCLPEQAFYSSGAVFDGEIVCLDGAGRPVFTDVMGRLHAKGERGIARAQGRHPAVCYLFDCLYLDGRPIVQEPLARRRAWLADAVRKTVEDGEALFEAAKSVGVEGIVAKERGGRYLPGKRASTWSKVKVRRTMECLIAGFTPGKGDRARSFGPLDLGRQKDSTQIDSPQYMGKVGGGFDARSLKSVLKELTALDTVERPVDQKPLDDAETTWVEPSLWCEVQYASLTNAGTLREPVFLWMRPDLADTIE